ncbi:hypothetical protein K469DRAFT_613986, partial [Zopfia rhizophila CBS 207.26]
IATRAQALALHTEGMDYSLIEAATGIKQRQIQSYAAEARKRGYNPQVSKVILDEHVQDKPRLGRLKKITPEKAQEVLDAVKKKYYSRELSIKALSTKVGLLANRV